ncbi:hypothetical protein [Janibacter corallicola]|uniref:hypothetical protein n=1 Tax=Janibacter corallicola TaxID=415212 RepID=UPI0034E21D91
MVEREVEIDYDELVGLGLRDTWLTLTCVSNEVGAGLVGTRGGAEYPSRGCSIGPVCPRARTRSCRRRWTGGPARPRWRRSPTGGTRCSPSR